MNFSGNSDNEDEMESIIVKDDKDQQQHDKIDKTNSNHVNTNGDDTQQDQTSSHSSIIIENQNDAQIKPVDGNLQNEKIEETITDSQNQIDHQKELENRLNEQKEEFQQEIQNLQAYIKQLEEQIKLNQNENQIKDSQIQQKLQQAQIEVAEQQIQYQIEKQEKEKANKDLSQQIYQNNELQKQLTSLQEQVKQSYQRGLDDGANRFQKNEEKRQADEKQNKEMRQKFVQDYKNQIQEISANYQQHIARQQQLTKQNTLQYLQRVTVFSMHQNNAVQSILSLDNIQAVASNNIYKKKISQIDIIKNQLKKFIPEQHSKLITSIQQQQNSKNQQFQINNIDVEDDSPQMVFNNMDQEKSLIDQFKIQLCQRYGKENMLFYHPLQTIQEVISGEDGEYKCDQRKQNLIYAKLQEQNITHVGKVRGDGNCFYRSLIIVYLKLRIAQTQYDTKQLQEFFNQLLKVQIMEPLSVDSYFSQDITPQFISGFVSEYLKEKFQEFIAPSSITPLKRFVDSLNNECFDFALQMLMKSILYKSYESCSDFASYQTKEDFKKEILGLNQEGGNTLLNMLINFIFNCNLKVLNSSNNTFDWIETDQSQQQPVELHPFFLNKIEQNKNQIVYVWFKTGHYYYFFTQQQMKQFELCLQFCNQESSSMAFYQISNEQIIPEDQKLQVRNVEYNQQIYLNQQQQAALNIDGQNKHSSGQQFQQQNPNLPPSDFQALINNQQQIYLNQQGNPQMDNFSGSDQPYLINQDNQNNNQYYQQQQFQQYQQQQYQQQQQWNQDQTISQEQFYAAQMQNQQNNPNAAIPNQYNLNWQQQYQLQQQQLLAQQQNYNPNIYMQNQNNQQQFQNYYQNNLQNNAQVSGGIQQNTSNKNSSNYSNQNQFQQDKNQVQSVNSQNGSQHNSANFKNQNFPQQLGNQPQQVQFGIQQQQFNYEQQQQGPQFAQIQQGMNLQQQQGQMQFVQQQQFQPGQIQVYQANQQNGPEAQQFQQQQVLNQQQQIYQQQGQPVLNNFPNQQNQIPISNSQKFKFQQQNASQFVANQQQYNNNNSS